MLTARLLYQAKDAYQLQWTNSTGSIVAAGSLVDLGPVFARAVADIAIGAVGTVEIDGVYTIAKNTGISFVAGEQVWFDATNSRCDKVGTANSKYGGLAFRSALSADTTMVVAINKSRSGQGGSKHIVVDGTAAALNSGNGRVTIDTGLGANLRTYLWKVRNSSNVEQNGYNVSDAAGVITIDGIGSGVQLDANWLVDVTWSA